MKRKASISHDEAIIRRLRKDPDFAAEYLKAALEDEDEPRVLLIALRHLAQAQGIAKVAKAAGIETRESLPGIVGSRQPSPVHASCRHQGDRVETHRRGRRIDGTAANLSADGHDFIGRGMDDRAMVATFPFIGLSSRSTACLRLPAVFASVFRVLLAGVRCPG